MLWASPLLRRLSYSVSYQLCFMAGPTCAAATATSCDMHAPWYSYICEQEFFPVCEGQPQGPETQRSPPLWRPFTYTPIMCTHVYYNSFVCIFDMGVSSFLGVQGVKGGMDTRTCGWDLGPLLKVSGCVVRGSAWGRGGTWARSPRVVHAAVLFGLSRGCAWAGRSAVGFGCGQWLL